MPVTRWFVQWSCKSTQTRGRAPLWAFTGTAAAGLMACASHRSPAVIDQHGPAGYEFGACRDASPARLEAGPVRSISIPMPDGVRIALDIALPTPLGAGARVPAVLQITRYRRGFEGEGPNDLERMFAGRGYAAVWMDARGTGASTGKWIRSRSAAETGDYAEVARWIARQEWSDGRVAGWGLSYGANTADYLAASGEPAVKAIVPLFPDFDHYADLLFPGGVFHLAFGKLWSDSQRQADLGAPSPGPNGTQRTVRRVDADTSGALLAAAVAERAGLPSMYDGLKDVTFRDDVPAGWDASVSDRSIHTHRAEAERARIPTMVWGGWLDAGTSTGVLHRFMTWQMPIRAVIGPWSHGARFHASPFLADDTPTVPTVEQQRREQMCWLDRYTRGGANGVSDDHLLVYYTLGEERWKTTKEFPLPGTRAERWYLDREHILSTTPPKAADGADRYTVDFDATTGTTNRWYTQRGGGDVIYPDRAAADGKLLVFTSAPLDADQEVTGFPVVSLRIRSTATDGAFFVYLEDVAPDGRVTYLTEGVLRAINRRVSSDPAYRMLTPYHSFLRKDAEPLVPGNEAELRFGLIPTSVLFRKGHRIRVAIGGADKDTFARVPADGPAPVVTLERNSRYTSYIDLPVAGRP
ncbi:MAG: CocE/NonD family hydrolase [Gemmatimonadota bacterium]